MGYALNLVYDHPVLAAIFVAFAIWMTVEAQRRGAEQFWYWIIWFVPLAGPLVFFVLHVAPDLSGWLGPLLQGGPSLAELEHRAHQAPTLANHLALGQALIARKSYAEAIPSLEAGRKIEPDHAQVLYGLAVCHVRLKQLEDAIPLLEAILRKDPRWGDDQAGVLLVEVHAERQDQATALARARDLVALAPTLKHKCLLAELLVGQGHASEARSMLEQAIQDHVYLPASLRRRNRAWASQAKRILRTMR